MQGIIMIQKYNLLPLLLFMFIALCTSCTTSSENLITHFKDNRDEYEQIIILAQADDASQTVSDEDYQRFSDAMDSLGVKSISVGNECVTDMITHEMRIRWSRFALASGYIYTCDNSPPEYAQQVDNIDAHQWDLVFDGGDGRMVYQQIDENWFIFTENVTRSFGLFGDIASKPTSIQILLICLSVGFIYNLIKGIQNVRHKNNKRALLNGFFSLFFLFAFYLYSGQA